MSWWQKSCIGMLDKIKEQQLMSLLYFGAGVGGKASVIRTEGMDKYSNELHWSWYPKRYHRFKGFFEAYLKECGIPVKDYQNLDDPLKSAYIEVFSYHTVIYREIHRHLPEGGYISKQDMARRLHDVFLVLDQSSIEFSFSGAWKNKSYMHSELAWFIVTISADVLLNSTGNENYTYRRNVKSLTLEKKYKNSVDMLRESCKRITTTIQRVNCYLDIFIDDDPSHKKSPQYEDYIALRHFLIQKNNVLKNKFSRTYRGNSVQNMRLLIDLSHGRGIISSEDACRFINVVDNIELSLNTHDIARVKRFSAMPQTYEAHLANKIIQLLDKKGKSLPLPWIEFLSNDDVNRKPRGGASLKDKLIDVAKSKTSFYQIIMAIDPEVDGFLLTTEMRNVIKKVKREKYYKTNG